MTIRAPKLCAPITIFEGPDAAGKSTAARYFAEVTGARYVHLGPFPGVGTGLAALYVQAMLPALLGYQAVVMDRCWISEPVYGEALRGGEDRIGRVYARMLERVARRGAAVVVRCLPSLEAVKNVWVKRLAGELINRESVLEAVYRRYAHDPLLTELDSLVFDYTRQPLKDLPGYVDDVRKLALHPAEFATGGAWPTRRTGKKVILLGERYAHHKNSDPLLQTPFVSFSNLGASAWLTQELQDNGVDERRLLWANADTETIERLPPDHPIIALGDVAAVAVKDNPDFYEMVLHPAYWKRFKEREPYPLSAIIRGFTNAN